MKAGAFRRPSTAAFGVRLATLGLSAAVAACSGGGEHGGDAPRLAVVIVVDQMCAHHVTRFRDLYSGGLHRLLEEGTVFSSAWHDHAKTHTSPGNATIATGSHPSRHGIVANRWYDRTRGFVETTSVGDDEALLVGRPDGAGASPRQMLHNAIGDWLKEASPNSKVYTVALKDYAAVLTGGAGPDAAFWYDRTSGTYCSSTYYMNAYPAWVNAFNDARPADDYRAAVWRRSMAEGVYDRSRPDRFAAEADGEHTTFPYPVSAVAEAVGEDFYSFLRSTPFADELTLRFAAAMVAGEELGGDGDPDLLIVGCSAADFIGHDWGPYSQEVQDYYLKLDVYLETFFASLDERVGSDDYIVVLTSDHGVDPLPESLAGKADDAQRIDRDRYNADVDRAAERVAAEFGVDRPLISHRSLGLVLDSLATAESGAPPSRLRSRLAERIEELPYVLEVYTYDELSAGPRPDAVGGGERDADYSRLVRNSFHRDRSADLYTVFQEHHLVTGSAHGTTHGSPHPYDRHVPLVFWGRGIEAQTVDSEVKTVDVAPTLAELIGIRQPDDIDGRALATVLRAPVAPTAVGEQSDGGGP